MSPDTLITTGWLGILCAILAIGAAQDRYVRPAAWVLGLLSLFLLVPTLTWMFIYFVGG